MCLDSQKTSVVCKNLCLLSAAFAFSVGLTVGILVPLQYLDVSPSRNRTAAPTAPQIADIETVFVSHSYARHVTFVDHHQDSGLVQRGIYWGDTVEQALPEGFRPTDHATWNSYVGGAAEAVKMETGCGRMQNRLVTFRDGRQACVRYRQNTDQIQGELFSFYLAQLLGLPNLAPSAVSVVRPDRPLWRRLAPEMAAAQWKSDRPVVLTRFVPQLAAAGIPDSFKPQERHLNKYDVANMTRLWGSDRAGLVDHLVELAQWSDLIVFDYLTANLDRVVNNLYNYQWNANIMDSPAHNLAKRSGDGLLVFLDNESGLLHGYRLLKKYEIYHSILLENLCVFRKSTADRIRQLKSQGDVGRLLRGMFDEQNGERVKDILPTIPNKSVKILNERIDKVFGQIAKCESIFANT